MKTILLCMSLLVFLSNSIKSQNITTSLGTKTGISNRDRWNSYKIGGTCIDKSTVLVVGYNDSYGGADWAFELPSDITDKSQLKSIQVQVLGKRCNLFGDKAKLTFRKTNFEWLDNIINEKLNNSYSTNIFDVPSRYVDDCIMEWNNGFYLMPIISSEDNY
jgi:hypothetical protein